MKRTLLLLLLSGMVTFLFGQQNPLRNLKELRPEPVPAMPSPHGTVLQAGNPNLPLLQTRALESVIGLTRFDAQTYGSLGHRLADFGDGTVSAAWLFSAESSGFSDRSTAYNYFDGAEWGTEPASGVESTRSGFPSFTATPAGTEAILSHKSATGSQWIVTAHTKQQGDADWTEYEIPSTVPGGPVWAKVAAGGPDGNALHVLAVSVAPDFGGAVYQGMNQHPLYYRSTDGGQTWDMVDVILPGLDSTFYNGISAEAYNIDAHGETVAVGIFDQWGDVALLKSGDNGETWTKTIIKDFPLDKYDNSGYGPGDIPLDTLAPDSISILTADGSGCLLVDDNGKVHVFFGWMYVEEFGGDRFYFPAMDGMAYWNEDYGTDEIATITYLEDFDGDGTVTLVSSTGIPYYGTNLSSHPTAGVDAEGHIYVVYSAIREDAISNSENQNYRHLFVIRSEDGGETWTSPYDLINTETTEIPEFVEAAFPSIPSRVGDALRLVYQQDFSPGMAVIGDMDVSSDNYIIYLEVDKNDYGLYTDATLVEPDQNSLVLSPNPAHGAVTVTVDMVQAGDVRLSLINGLGETMAIRSFGAMPRGPQRLAFDLNGVSRGLYFIRVETEGQVVSGKLIVE